MGWRARWFLSLIGALLSVGCSTMRVTTEIYQPPPLTAQEVAGVKAALKGVEESLAGLPQRAEREASQSFIRHMRSYEPDIAEALGDLAPFSASYADAVRASVLEPTDERRIGLIAQAEYLRAGLFEEHAAKIDRFELEARLAPLRGDLAIYTKELNARLDEVYEDNVEYLVKALAGQSGEGRLCGDSAADCKATIGPAVSQINVDTKAVTVGPVEARGSAIAEAVEHLPLADERVAEIVSARDRKWYLPEDDDTGYWEKYVNDVEASGYFGNSEFSIVMRSLGSYHLKGVVFDPSQVSQATLDTMAQAINIAAAAYGVPVRAGLSEGEQPPLTLPEIQGQLAGIEVAGQTRQARMHELFSLLLSQDSKITTDAEAQQQKDELVKVIRDAAAKLRSGE